MKQRIKITESYLRKMVREALLSEGGHLYFKDDEGHVHTNSKELYRNVPGAIFISHGMNADAEIYYDNHEINYYDAEDCLWGSYKEECEENGVVPTVDDFENWVAQQGPEYVQGVLDDLVWAADGCQESIQKSRLNELEYNARKGEFGENNSPSPEEEAFEDEFTALVDSYAKIFIERGLDINSFKSWCNDIIDSYYR